MKKTFCDKCHNEINGEINGEINEEFEIRILTLSGYPEPNEVFRYDEICNTCYSIIQKILRNFFEADIKEE